MRHQRTHIGKATGKPISFAFPPRDCLVWRGWRVVEKQKTVKRCLANPGLVDLEEVMFLGVSGEGLPKARQRLAACSPFVSFGL